MHSHCTACVHTHTHLAAADDDSITPSVSHRLNFTRISLHSILCINISIVDNDIAEDVNKSFNIYLTADSALVSVGEPAIVNVTDDDCEW